MSHPKIKIPKNPPKLIRQIGTYVIQTSSRPK